MTDTMALNFGTLEPMAFDELFEVDGGGSLAAWASVAGGVYTLAGTLGAAGCFGVGIAAACCAPVAVASFVVVGALTLGYSIYCAVK